MKRFFRNIPWKNVLIITLVVVLGVGAIAGISAIAKEEKKTISSIAFKRGALNNLGFYIESDQSIYTKDLIECQGLEIEPDFETIGTYQVYYYDANKQFIDKTDKINSQTDGVYVKGDNHRFAKYCRIVITPEAPKDEDGHVIEDYAIKFYEVAGIAGKYKISVNKEQNFTSQEVSVEVDKAGCYYSNNKETFVIQDNVSVTAIQKVSNYDFLRVWVPVNEASVTTIIQFFDAKGNNMNYEWTYNDDTYKEGDFWIRDIEIPEGAEEFCIVLVNSYEANYRAVLYN